MKKHILLITLITIIVSLLCIGSAFAESNQCGDNLTWRIDGTTLYIDGNGDMWDMDWGTGGAFDPITESTADDQPWKGLNFNRIVLSDRVTSIGAYAFADCSAEELSLSIGNNSALKRIGKYAFYRTNIKSFNSNNVEIIDESAFSNCWSLEEVLLGNNLREIGDSAFTDCFSMGNIVIPATVENIGVRAFDRYSVLDVISGSAGYKYAVSNCDKYIVDGVIAEKIKDTITVAGKTNVTTSSEVQTVDLMVSHKSNAKLTYKIGSERIKVSSKGVITIPANYVGKTTITITSAATGNYLAATKKVTLTVKPKNTSLVSLSNPSKGVLKAEWKKASGITGYQIQYSNNSSFTGSDTHSVNVTSASTVSKTLTSNISNTGKYYVRLRTYKTVSGTKIYSSWSSKKAITITKANVLDRNDIQIKLKVASVGTTNNYSYLNITNNSSKAMTDIDCVGLNGSLYTSETSTISAKTTKRITVRVFTGKGYLDNNSWGYMVFKWNGQQYYAEFDVNGITEFWKGNVNGPQ